MNADRRAALQLKWSAAMLAVSQYRKDSIYSIFIWGGQFKLRKVGNQGFEMYGLTNAEKYMLLAFEVRSCAVRWRSRNGGYG